jgi:predicted negative regulator of RcsB-dependent stress response
MAKGKEKLSRKEMRQELREPDLILEKGSELMGWARKNTPKVVAAGGTLLVLLLGMGTYRAYQAAQSRDANTDLARAMATLAGTDPAAASRDLSSVAQRWSGTSVGRLAATLAANADVRSGALDEAVQAADQIPAADLPDYLRQQLQLLAATVLEQKGEIDRAAERYAAAAQMSGPYTADALIAQARLATLKNEPQRAAELSRQVFEQFPDRPDRDRYKTALN